MTSRKYRRQIITQYRQMGISWKEIKMILNGTSNTLRDGYVPNSNPHKENE
ncbi:MAG: hypothetical protein LBV22_01855 [Mycoplasmataceae bacterium]|nr:hypothetical protein [Mycoplasmataceae bacterium]